MPLTVSKPDNLLPAAVQQNAIASQGMNEVFNRSTATLNNVLDNIASFMNVRAQLRNQRDIANKDINTRRAISQQQLAMEGLRLDQERESDLARQTLAAEQMRQSGIIAGENLDFEREQFEATKRANDLDFMARMIKLGDDLGIDNIGNLPFVQPKLKEMGMNPNVAMPVIDSVAGPANVPATDNGSRINDLVTALGSTKNQRTLERLGHELTARLAVRRDERDAAQETRLVNEDKLKADNIKQEAERIKLAKANEIRQLKDSGVDITGMAKEFGFDPSLFSGQTKFNYSPDMSIDDLINQLPNLSPRDLTIANDVINQRQQQEQVEATKQNRELIDEERQNRQRDRELANEERDQRKQDRAQDMSGYTAALSMWNKIISGQAKPAKPSEVLNLVSTLREGGHKFTPDGENLIANATMRELNTGRKQLDKITNPKTLDDLLAAGGEAIKSFEYDPDPNKPMKWQTLDRVVQKAITMSPLRQTAGDINYNSSEDVDKFDSSLREVQDLQRSAGADKILVPKFEIKGALGGPQLRIKGFEVVPKEQAYSLKDWLVAHQDEMEQGKKLSPYRWSAPNSVP